jgi:hypothetical protein
MKNVKNVNAKTASAKTVSTDAKKKITNLNLSAFADKLKNVEVKEKRDKSTIYIYPDGFSKTDINSEKGKKFRSSLRTKMQRFENNIFVFAKTNNSEKLIETVKEFNNHYKQFYVNNDYSVKSISSSNKDEKAQSFELMMQIIKDVNNKTK